MRGQRWLPEVGRRRGIDSGRRESVVRRLQLLALPVGNDNSFYQARPQHWATEVPAHNNKQSFSPEVNESLFSFPILHEASTAGFTRLPNVDLTNWKGISFNSKLSW